MNAEQPRAFKARGYFMPLPSNVMCDIFTPLNGIVAYSTVIKKCNEGVGNPMKKIGCMRVLSLILVLSMLTALCLSGCANNEKESLYAQAENWAYLEKDASEKTADVFFICPTVYGNSGLLEALFASEVGNSNKE